MQRIPEPELMDDAAQAAAYAAADFSEPNAAFVGHFLGQFPGFRNGRVVDLGCGPGDITLRLARALPSATLTGVDGAGEMLALAEAALGEAPGLAGRVCFELGRLPVAPAQDGFDAVVSNSLLHHLPEPAVLWQTALRVGRPGAALLVMDLVRPGNAAAAQALVDRHAQGAPEVLRTDFYNSLLAAFEPGEVAAQLQAAGLDGIRVSMVSDRHWLASGRLPA